MSTLPTPSAPKRPRLPKFKDAGAKAITVEAAEDEQRHLEERANMFALLGTRKNDAVALLLSSLGSAVVGDSTAAAVTAGAELLAAMEPQNMAERLLMVQAIAAHEQAMRMIRLTDKATPEGIKLYAGLADRFMRTYAVQMEALHKMRHGGQQRMTVEHVTVSEGGQAIIGTVNGKGAGGDG